MLDNLHWLGHSGFRWEGSKTLYFDPYKLASSAKKADVILVSHEHFDHCSIDDIAKISTGETAIVASDDAGKELQRAKVLCNNIFILTPGGSISISGIKIIAVAAYNTNKKFHTKGSNKLGFVVTMDGISVYHAGDTDDIPEMKDIKCDIALVPVSGTYVMTADEAARAVLNIKPRYAVPMHYGEVAGTPEDAKRFQGLLKDRIETRILKKEK
ncbi:MAG: MBL fold metallo-hydrolase [Candidatus Omnitrophica bacterium]|nr:MBL fold metallo-hydrolase [Candidatus Omnitrophota bacterium]